MTVDQAGTFLVSTILMSLGIGVIGVVILFLNNIYYRFWKTTGFAEWAKPWGNHTVSFVEPDTTEPKVEPKLDKGGNNERRTGQTKT